MSIWEAVWLAIIEGLTEFLPVSSTGHLIVATHFFGIAQHPFTKLFVVAIQLGAIASVVALYWKRFLQSTQFYFTLFIAFIPSMVVGLLLGSYIDMIFERVEVVAFALLAGGIVLVLVDKWFEANEHPNNTTEINNKSAFIIGWFQCLAIVLPGMSRSASTIIGGLTQKLNRRSAAEFSFLLAVPTMVAATGYKLLTFTQTMTITSHDITLLAIGNIVAFVVAWLAIRGFINFLAKAGFKIFGYYRIALGLLILVLHFAGIQFSIL